MKPTLLRIIFAFACCFAAQVSRGQIITTVAGCDTCSALGDGGPATAAFLKYPNGGVFDKKGNYYCASSVSGRIRKIDTAGIISTVAGNGILGYSGDGGPATNARLGGAEGVAVDSSGNIYFCDSRNYRVRKVNAITGIISTIAGDGISGYNGDGILAANAQLEYPSGICIDKNNNIFICELSYRVRKINGRTKKISTYAGNSSGVYTSGDGPATSAYLFGMLGIAADVMGNIYIADASCHCVKKVDTSGIIHTVAGTGTNYYGENIPATSAYIEPNGICADQFGNLIIADWRNYKVRRVDSSGYMQTIAGDGTTGYSGDGGPATSAQIFPSGVTFDTCGNLFISEANNNHIRKLTFPSCNYLSTNPIIPNSNSLIPNSQFLEIYPNPATDQLHITLPNNSYTTLSITSSIGQLMQLQTINRVSIEVDVRRYAPGMYYVMLSGNDGMLVRKWVKE